MRINKFVALATGISRRQADKLISSGAVTVNGQPSPIGHVVKAMDAVAINSRLINLPHQQILMLNKPVGYVCSRNGQGSKTIYDILPAKYHNLKPVGRLDKNSSGLLLLTNDGDLSHQLTHPSFQKTKEYIVTVRPNLTEHDRQQIEQGVELVDGLSRLRLSKIRQGWQVMMSEGRNRQIRRTFEALNYHVITLHRIRFGTYDLGDLQPGLYQSIQQPISEENNAKKPHQDK